MGGIKLCCELSVALRLVLELTLEILGRPDGVLVGTAESSELFVVSM
jgi:hypothetical protein